MDNNSGHIAYLWGQYFSGKATAAELEELLEYNSSQPNDEESSALIENMLSRFPVEKEMDQESRERMLQALLAEQGHGVTVRKVRRMAVLQRYVAAAAVLMVLGLGVYLWQKGENSAAKTITATAVADMPPGKNGAILTLADGTKMILDSLGNGVIAHQTGAQVVLKDGQLTYDPTGAVSGELTYNTMSTPAGRQFSLLLPDGSRVWLNAASSIRFPTSFAGKARQVEVSGEVYFDVADNPAMPFQVSLPGGGEIEVLGTQFNVHGYENEKTITTTLVAGRIRIKKGNDAALLRPGQQAKLAEAVAGIAVAGNANIEMVTAWKNGVFNFEGMGLEEAMRQVERWYNIQVSYPEGVPAVHFGGEMDRNVSLSQLLTILKNYGVKVKMQDGGKMIILNN